MRTSAECRAGIVLEGITAAEVAPQAGSGIGSAESAIRNANSCRTHAQAVRPLVKRPGPRKFERVARSYVVARADSRPAFFPKLFPIPDAGFHRDRQREPELMGEHAHLPAMVGFVRKHVAQHFHANRPRLAPAVPVKL